MATAVISSARAEPQTTYEEIRDRTSISTSVTLEGETYYAGSGLPPGVNSNADLLPKLMLFHTCNGNVRRCPASRISGRFEAWASD